MTHWHSKRIAVSAQGGQALVWRRASGFTYIGVLMLVAMMGVALAAAGQVWHTMQQREKEQELLFIGHQFRLALNRYAGPTGSFPRTLEDLLQDPRHPSVERHLRKIYRDPMTGRAEWGLVTGPNGEIYGVHSLSDKVPLKQANFGLEDRQFEGKTNYSEWVFMGSSGHVRHRLSSPADDAADGGA